MKLRLNEPPSGVRLAGKLTEKYPQNTIGIDSMVYDNVPVRW